MIDEPESEIAICWFSRNEWELVKASAVDKEAQDDTYEEWKANANWAIRNFRAKGQRVAKVAVKSKELLAWCAENDLENNAQARSQFAADKLIARREKA